MRRVVLVLADGLRPDAITPTDMPSLDALARTYTMALRASTVRPSRTVAAAVEVDAAIGVLSDLTEHALVIVMADHGGGGVSTHDHVEPHPINDHIPLILAGPDVTRRHQLTRQVSLLDVPPTLLWWFGLDVPTAYEGRVLTQAFTRTSDPVEAGV